MGEHGGLGDGGGGSGLIKEGNRRRPKWKRRGGGGRQGRGSHGQPVDDSDTFLYPHLDGGGFVTGTEAASSAG